MKVKYIKDLSEAELISYKQSDLYINVIRNYMIIPIHLSYYKEYYGKCFHDFSLVAFDKNGWYISLYAITKNSILSFFNQPIVLETYFPNSKIASLALQELFLKLGALGATGGIQELYMYENRYFTHHFFEKGIKDLSIENWCYVDLLQNEEEIRQNIRKSFKSLINWGYKNLEIKIIDHTNITKNISDSFRDFHIRVAKRQTRSFDSWNLQFEAVKQGMGFWVSAHLIGEGDHPLVSCVYICLSGSEAYYGVAVNDRELMAQNLPLGHTVLLESILKAKKLGISKFVLGEVSFVEDEKVNAITKYKRGFSNTIEKKISYKVNLK